MPTDTAQNVAEYIWKYVNATTGLVTNLAGASAQYQYGIVDWPAGERFSYDMTTAVRTTVNILAVDQCEVWRPLPQLWGVRPLKQASTKDAPIQLTTGHQRKNCYGSDGIYNAV